MKNLRKVFVGEIKEIDEKTRTLVSVVSTGAVDRMGDVIEPEGVDLKNYRKNPVVMWAHDYSQPPIGRALWIKKVDGAIVAKMEFANTPMAEEIFQLYQGGFLKAFSIGFVPKEHEPIEKEGGFFGPRRYKKIEMIEYSAVPVPANPEALTMAIKKGVLKTESVKRMLEDSDLDDMEESFIQGEEKETETKELKIEPLAEIKKIEVNEFEDLKAENDLFQEKIKSLESENQELRYKLYEQLEKTRKQLSEMTAKNFANQIGEVTRGVIRELQGRLD